MPLRALEYRLLLKFSHINLNCNRMDKAQYCIENQHKREDQWLELNLKRCS
jgi:hypothetical protein